MRVGIVGAGAIARRGHLPAYGSIPDVEVVGIADRDRLLAKKVAEEFKIPRHCGTCEELLEDNSITMVDVCTPTPTHLEIVGTAANRGRHILVEKPLASSLHDAREIKRIVTENGIKLCVVQNWRYFPSVTAAKQRISGGYLGKLVTVHGLGLATFPTHWTLGTWLYHRGGALYDFGPHLIDMILWMKDFSPVRSVYASGGDFSQGNMDFVNYAVTNIEFADGSIATADISWVTSMMLRFTLDMHGTGGSIFLDIRNDVLSETRGVATPFDDAGFFLRKMWRMGTGIVTGDFFKGANLGYRPLITAYLKSIHGEGQIPVPIEHAIITNLVLEAAEQSLCQHRPVDVEELANSGAKQSAK